MEWSEILSIAAFIIALVSLFTVLIAIFNFGRWAGQWEKDFKRIETLLERVLRRLAESNKGEGEKSQNAV